MAHARRPEFPLPRDGKAYVTLLAGGDKFLHRLLRPRLFEEFAIDIQHHWDYKPRANDAPIPSDVELVVMCVEMVNNSFSQWLVKTCKRANVPLAYIGRQKSDYVKGLENLGLEYSPRWRQAVERAGLDDEELSPHAKAKKKAAAALAARDSSEPSQGKPELVEPNPEPAAVTPIKPEFPRFIPFRQMTDWHAENDSTLVRVAEAARSVEELLENYWRERGEYRTSGALGLRISNMRHAMTLVWPELTAACHRDAAAKRRARDHYIAKERREGPMAPWISRDLATEWLATPRRFALAQSRGHITQIIDRELELVVVDLQGTIEAVQALGPYRVPHGLPPHNPPHLARALGLPEEPESSKIVEPAVKVIALEPNARPDLSPVEPTLIADPNPGGPTMIRRDTPESDARMRFLRKLRAVNRITLRANTKQDYSIEIANKLVADGLVVMVRHYGDSYHYELAPRRKVPAPPVLDPAELVVEAVRGGAHNQQEIAKALSRRKEDIAPIVHTLEKSGVLARNGRDLAVAERPPLTAATWHPEPQHDDEQEPSPPPVSPPPPPVRALPAAGSPSEPSSPVQWSTAPSPPLPPRPSALPRDPGQVAYRAMLYADFEAGLMSAELLGELLAKSRKSERP